MGVKIRLARAGAKKRPYYRIVAADGRAPRDGRYLERLGSYDPLLPRGDERRVVIDLARAQEWLARGAKPTDRVARMLEAASLLPERARNNPEKAKPGKKAQERAAELAEKAKAASGAAGPGEAAG